MDRIREEKGFIYPFTLIACLLVLMLVFIQVHVYLSEKQFVSEKERLIMLESLIQVSVQQLRKGNLDVTYNEEVVIHYDEGTVILTVGHEQNGISDMTVHVTLTTGHQRRASFVFDWETRLVESYKEVSKY